MQVELAQYAHLCTIMSNMHHRRAGYPFGTIVDFASDGAGCPLFCLSPLAIHTRNIMEDPRCSLVVQMPGWTGMANARVTIFGDVYQLPPDMHEAAREVTSCTSSASLLWPMLPSLHYNAWASAYYSGMLYLVMCSMTSGQNLLDLPLLLFSLGSPPRSTAA